MASKNKDEKQFSKKKMLSLTLILVLTISTLTAVTTLLPSAFAANRTPYAFLSVAPSPIGVEQTVAVVMWLDVLPPIAADGTQTAWENFNVKITTPSGATENRGPINSDAVASAYFSYTPAEIGTYKFQFSFPGQNAVDGNYYEPATSPEVTLVVQQEQIQGWTPTPIPTGYWQRPIYGENREWYELGGNWLGVPLTYGNGYSSSGAFNPYTKAPESAHILWNKEVAWGGIVGGDLNTVAYYTGLSYQSKYAPPIIMYGKLFYNLPLSDRNNAGGAVCVDLRTGEQTWWQNITLTVGQIYDYESPNQHGAIPYLWQTGSTYRMYDPLTGNLLLTLANASAGRITISPKGDLIVYVLNGQNNYLIKWNSSYAQYNYPGTVGSSAWQWRPPIGTVQDWKAGIEWNVSVPDVPGRQTIACIGDGVIVATSQADDTTITTVGYDANTGAQKWVTNLTSNVALRPNYFVVPANNGIFLFFRQETMQFTAYSLETGTKVWTTKPYDNAWGMYTSSVVGLGASNPQIAYDTLYSVAYDGKIHAYDAKTGDNLWEFYTGSAGFETPYGTYPLGSGTFAIADGKIYAATGEHSPNVPMWRGGRIYCVDAYNGKGIWNLTGWWQNPAVADGYLTAFNNYDSKVYCIGKGQTATTITTTPGIGNIITIQGTVTDQSPGQTCLGIPAKGTPAIADEYMTQWMEYLYMQKPKPTDATGVLVKLTAIDQNGQNYNIGTVTTDNSGTYAISWAPPTAGLYKVVATFEGSKSYYESSAQTHFSVDFTQANPITPPTSNPPQTTPPQTTQPTPPTPSPIIEQPPTSQTTPTTLILISATAIIIAITLTALILNKHNKHKNTPTYTKTNQSLKTTKHHTPTTNSTSSFFKIN